MRFKILIVVLCFGAVSAIAFARNAFTTYDEIEPVLKSLDSSIRRSAWPEWISGHDREIRKRLSRGDEDTLANWLLLGTSFTKEARVYDLPPTSPELPRVISKRTTDLITALRSSRADERTVFARRLLSSQGYGFDNAQQRSRLEQHLRDEIKRILGERQEYARREDSYRPGDFAEQMMAQSRLFRDRGLSLDTSILSSFALDQALEAMKNNVLLPAGSVLRVAVIGPGLDFADKSSGYDFYPVQTLQPFALIDSLARLGIASDADHTELTTFDISARVNEHVLGVHNRAKIGLAYTLTLPLDLRTQWTPPLVDYWKHLGSAVASETNQQKTSSVNKGVEIRTIAVRPQVTAHVSAEDFNIVTERWSGQPFDLVVATNVLVYYDELDQTLAFAAIEAMLRPGGFFLTNNAIVEPPVSRLRSVGFATVRHSDEISDHVFWYRRM
jgi:hypothetical protein